MAHFKVLERTFLGTTLHEEGAIVEIKNTDPSKGGMRPGRTLAECSAEGVLKASKPAKQAPEKAPEAPASDVSDLG